MATDFFDVRVAERIALVRGDGIAHLNVGASERLASLLGGGLMALYGLKRCGAKIDEEQLCATDCLAFDARILRVHSVVSLDRVLSRSPN
jgi:hypothetical protein